MEAAATLSSTGARELKYHDGCFSDWRLQQFVNKVKMFNRQEGIGFKRRKAAQQKSPSTRLSQNSNKLITQQ